MTKLIPSLHSNLLFYSLSPNGLASFFGFGMVRVKERVLRGPELCSFRLKKERLFSPVWVGSYWVLTHRIFFRGPSDLPFFWLALVFRQAKSTRRLILIFFISSRTTSIESFVQRMMKVNSGQDWSRWPHRFLARSITWWDGSIICPPSTWESFNPPSLTEEIVSDPRDNRYILEELKEGRGAW
jgi:hypothetical protein